MRESAPSGETKIIGYSPRDTLRAHPYARNVTTAGHNHSRLHHRTSSSSPSRSPIGLTENSRNSVSLPSIRLKKPQRLLTSSRAPLPPTKSRFNIGGNRSTSNGGSITPSFQAQWMFFSNSHWIPLDTKSHLKLERTLQLDGVFVDIQDSHFPGVERIRVFPGADYLSYLGIRYRICRVLLPSL